MRISFVSVDNTTDYAMFEFVKHPGSPTRNLVSQGQFLRRVREYGGRVAD